jgi:hypothetical protein
MSMFLKLSTSSDALLLPKAALSAVVRSWSASFSWGSSEARVLANGLAGTPLGDMTG